MKKILFSVIVFLVGSSLYAQWNGDPTIGTNLSKSTPGGVASSKQGVVAVTDDAGGMFVAWIDNRASSTPTVFLQRVGPDGVLKFTDDVVVSNATGASSSAKSNLTMIPDGTGGVILSWQDSRNFSAANPSNSDIYGQRIDAAGLPVWALNGVRLTAADNSISNKTISALEILVNTPSTTKGVVVFQDNRNGNVDLYAQTFSLATGALAWTADFPIHGTTIAETQNQQSVVNDGEGGFYVGWQDLRSGAGSTADVYAQHVLDAGTTGSIPTANGWPADGKVISAQAFAQLQPQLVSVGTSGFVLAWTDQRGGSGNGDIYINRYNSDGTVAWAAGEVALTNLSGNQSNPQIIETNGNYIITWSDARAAPSNRDIYAQGVTSTGTLLWSTATNGVPIAVVSGNQPANVSATSIGLSIVSDGFGGAIIVWDDARNNATSGTDIYAQRINSSGAVEWATNGVQVSTAAGTQTMPVAVQSNGGRALVAWRDSRNATLGDVYGARLQSNGVLPVRSININAVTKSSSVDIRWNTVDEENTDKFIVEKSNDGVTFTSIGSVKAKGSGNGSYILEDVRPVKGFNYYRVKAIDVNRAFRYSSVVSAQFNNAPKASMVIYPNPVQGQATLQLANLDAGTYQLKVRDLTGRTIVQRTVAIANNYAVLDLPLQQIAAGSYFVQLETAQRIVLSSSIQKQ